MYWSKYCSPDASWSYIIAFIIVEVMLTAGLPLIPAYMVWRSLMMAISTRFIISFSIYVIFLLVIIKIKDILSGESSSTEV